MKSETERRGPRMPWHELAEHLLERLPGVVSAIVEGTRHSVAEVRVWYEPDRALGEIMDSVHACLTGEADARLAATRFHAVVAQPDRRAERRAQPEPEAPPVMTWGPAPDSPLRLAGHRVAEVEPGVLGVEVWIDWHGRTFSGAAVGPDAPPGSLRTPALATLRALHSCLQILYDGPVPPGLVLDSAVRVTVEDSPVVVVALTAFERARPRPLTSAWPDHDGASALAVILATLHATSRTITRWLIEARPTGAASGAADAESRAAAAGGADQRFALVDYEVDRRPTGDVDVGVRLSGHGGAVDRHRKGSDDELTHVQLGAAATLDAVRALLRQGGWDERSNGALRRARAHRLRTAEQDIVVVLAEALLDGRPVPLAGATSADNGLERASITATLQATNPFVAGRAQPAADVRPAEGLGAAPVARA